MAAAGVNPITLSTSGVLSIADVDQGQSTFAVQAGTTGSNHYGTLHAGRDAATGATAPTTRRRRSSSWAPANRSPTASPAVSFDGTREPAGHGHHHRHHDVPVIGGDQHGSVSEDNGAAGVAAITLMTSGVLSIADVDQGQSTFAVQAGHHGEQPLRHLHAGRERPLELRPPTTRRRRSSSWAPANRSPTASPRSPSMAPRAS